MSVINNQRLFSTVEFDQWAYNKGLGCPEEYLIKRYLDKKGKTLEAGTGGGRILLEMKRMGFHYLYGFDYVPRLIQEARKKDPTESIYFEVQDGTSLSYGESFFDQVIYLAQIICVIEEEASRLKALQEAYRVLKTGGTALFSFLSFEARSRSAIYQPYLFYLRLFRTLRRSKQTIQSLPWLKLGGKFNFSAVVDARPYVYWYRPEEVYQLLRKVGFQIIAIGSSYQIGQGRMHQSYEALLNEPIDGPLYFVARK